MLAQGGALNADPDFDNTYANSAGPWVPFYISNQHPAISKTPKGAEGWPSGPALFMFADQKTFDAGVYQVVAVTPGHGYHFEVDWAAVRFSGGTVSPDIGKLARQVGMDPYGGTNPLAPSVQWSGEHREASHFQVPGLAMDQFAQRDHITIFLRAKNDYTDARAEVFFDHAILTENTGMGVITVAPPTPSAAPATTTRTAAPTQARTRVAQAPSATATAQPSPSFTATALATNTLPPTATRTRRPTVVPEETSNTSSGETSWASILIAVGALGALGGGLLVLGFVIFHLLGRTAI